MLQLTQLSHSFNASAAMLGRRWKEPYSAVQISTAEPQNGSINGLVVVLKTTDKIAVDTQNTSMLKVLARTYITSPLQGDTYMNRHINPYTSHRTPTQIGGKAGWPWLTKILKPSIFALEA